MGRRLLREWLLVGSYTTLLTAGLHHLNATADLDNAIYDNLQRLQRPIVAPAVVVTIDNESLAAAGQVWPWPRTFHAALIAEIAAARPRAIVYNVLFPEPSADKAEDEVLARAIQTAGNVYLPNYFIPNGAGGEEITDPAPLLKTAAAGVGVANVEAEPDGVVRRLGPAAAAGSLPQMVRDGVGRAPAPVKAAALAQARPVFGLTQALLKPVSAGALLRGVADGSPLRGQVVFVGVTATGVGETFRVPTVEGPRSVYGPELQAQLFAALDAGALTRPAPRWVNLALNIVLIWVLMAALLFMPPRRAVLSGACLIVISLLINSLLLLGFGVWATPSAGLVGMAAALLLWGWRRLAATSEFLELQAQRLPFVDPNAPPRAGDLTDKVLKQALILQRGIDWIEARRRFAMEVLASLPDATLVADAEGQVVAANAAAARLFAEAARPLEGAAVIALFDLLNIPRAILTPTWPHDAPRAPHEVDLTDGRTLEVQAGALSTPDGAPGGWVLRLADITAQKAALRQREGAIQLLSHDLRSPLAATIALLDREPAHRIAADLKTRTLTYTGRALHLANGFIELAKAEVAEIAAHPVDLADLVVNAVDELWPLAQDRGLTLDQTGEREGVWVSGDGSLLFRVIVNLLANAVKYSPPEERIEVGVGRRQRDGVDWVTVWVENKGQGIDPEARAHLFDRFYTRPASARERAIGLGLPFVKAAVQRHGGSVSCTAWCDDGVRFVLQLPAADAMA